MPASALDMRPRPMSFCHATRPRGLDGASTATIYVITDHVFVLHIMNGARNYEPMLFPDGE